MRSPVSASPQPSRTAAHDSGSMWFATPSSRGTRTPYSLPVSRRTDTRPAAAFGHAACLVLLELCSRAEGLRFFEPAPRAAVRSTAAKLDQAGLVRMLGQRPLLQPLAHPRPEGPALP